MKLQFSGNVLIIHVASLYSDFFLLFRPILDLCRSLQYAFFSAFIASYKGSLAMINYSTLNSLTYLLSYVFFDFKDLNILCLAVSFLRRAVLSTDNMVLVMRLLTYTY